MGWLFMPFTSMGGHKTAKSYLDAQLTYEKTLEDGTKRGLRVLASSCPGNRTYYAAAQEIMDGIPGIVFAVVCLVRWNPRSRDGHQRSEEHTSELQSLMRISYAVFCLKKKNTQYTKPNDHTNRKSKNNNNTNAADKRTTTTITQ